MFLDNKLPRSVSRILTVASKVRKVQPDFYDLTRDPVGRVKYSDANTAGVYVPN